jgi:tetratricopeptide (TPR) repeat protein
MDMDDRQQALVRLQKALQLWNLTDDKSGKGNTLTNIGAVYAKLGDRQKALDYLNRALAIFRNTGSLTGEAVTLGNLGDLYFDSGDQAKAFESYRRALPLLIANNEKLREIQLLDGIMEHYQSAGLLRPAIFFGKQCVNKIQALRQRIRDFDTDTQKAFLHNVEGAYQGLAQALTEDGQLEQAVHVINLYRDQQLLDFNDDPSPPDAKLPPESPREAAVTERYR